MKERKIYYLMRSLNLNLATVPLYGCFARGDQITLRATFDDRTSNFTQHLEKKRESTIHQRNIQALMKETSLQTYKQPISSYYRPHVLIS